ncbi:hypothetical protein AB3S75_040229 [Citrus x aurantiifolia]
MCKCRSHGTFPLFGLQSSHLNICYYHQDLHRRPLRPGSRPGFCGDRRALLLIGAWHLPRRPVGHRNPASGSSRIASSAYQKWPTWSTRFRGAAQRSSRANSLPGSSYPEGNFGGNQLLDGSISLSPLYPSQTNDLHVSMLALEPFSEDQGRSAVHPRGIPPISFLAPYGFTGPLTRTHVRLLGPCFKTGRMGSPQADAGSAQVREARPEGARCQPRSRRRRLHRLIEGPGLGRRRNPHHRPVIASNFLGLSGHSPSKKLATEGYLRIAS